MKRLLMLLAAALPMASGARAGDPVSAAPSAPELPRVRRWSSTSASLRNGARRACCRRLSFSPIGMPRDFSPASSRS